MAEYYPLLAKAVSSLPNSTPDTRRIVYERARKALIGQLRTLHPPVPDEDIERESVALDKAIERLEDELAAAPPSSPPSPPSSAPRALTPKPDERPVPPAGEAKKPSKPAAPSSTSAVAKKPPPPLRPRVPKPRDEPPALSGDTPPTGDARPGTDIAAIGLKPPALPQAAAPKPVEPEPVDSKAVDSKLLDSKSAEPKPAEPKLAEPKLAEPKLVDAEPLVATGEKAAKPGSGDNDIKPRLEVQRPIAPQPPVAKGAKPRIWIIPAGIVIVIALVAAAAWKLRDRPETLARSKPVEQTQGDTGKIADRVGGSQDNAGEAAPEPPAAPTPDDAAAAKPGQPESPRAAAPPADTTPAQPAPAQGAPQPAPAGPQSTPAATNPEVPVGYRAALLVEAPDEAEKVKTYLGTVVWKLNNVNGGPGDAVGLGVEADIDIPTDGVKIVVTIEKNADASLPASHVIKVRFTVQPGSATGDVKRLSVPQMRREDVQTGVPLAGVSVPVLQNSFLVGLTPGNSESANLKLLGDLEWIDIPMLLSSGKIAKLTFDKGASGQRDIAEALAAWQKQ